MLPLNGQIKLVKITGIDDSNHSNEATKTTLPMKTNSAHSKQTFLNQPSDCQWLRETHLADRNLKNALPFEFKSFCLFGNEDCPTEILIYRESNPVINGKCYRAMLMDNDCYSLFPV